ncbi:MAG: PHP domain-containing protein [Candidatus Woesearchaeota archaeon]
MDYRSICVKKNFASDLILRGYSAMDPHCHTSFSYDVPDVPETNPLYVIKKQSDKHLIPTITDHDTLNGYLNAKKNNNYAKKIISGVEIRIKPKIARLIDHKNIHTLHINVFGLTTEQFNILEDISIKTGDLDKFIGFIKEENLEWMYNHPFWHETHERLQWRAIPGLAKNYFDVIELNASMPKSFNDLSLHIAEKFNKGVIASTDSHTGNPGTAFVIAEGKTFRDFWQNIKESKMYILRGDMTPLGVVKESSMMINNIFRSNINPRPEQYYKPSVGFKTIDKISASVTTGALKNKLVIKKTLHMIMQTLNYSAGPILAWKLYVRKNNVFADEIKNRLESITARMKLGNVQKISAMTSTINSKLYKKNMSSSLMRDVKAKKKLI